MVRVGSLRKRILEAWVKNPYDTALKVCSDLQLDYKQHGNYINKLLSEFRSYYNFGSPQEALLPEHRVFEWEKIERVYDNLVEMPVFVWKAGWRVVANRNDMWVFRDPRGAIHWYQGGLVRLYLKGELQLAKAKELFCRAFGWFTPQDLRKYLDVPLKEVYKKWTFEVGAPVPRFDIRNFERSHGLRIFTDGSHPRAIHVGESTFDLKVMLDEQRQINSEYGEVIKQTGELVQRFGVEIEEHMKLIRLWQREAKHVRGKQPKPEKRRIAEAKPQKSLFDWLF